MAIPIQQLLPQKSPVSETTITRSKQERIEQERTDSLNEVQSILNTLFVRRRKEVNLQDPEIYSAHSKLVVACANSILAKKNRRFVIDDHNRLAIRFLLYYFNGSPLAEDVFPDRHYDLNKNILLAGNAGVGKTLLMEVFSLYCNKTNNPRAFRTISQTQLLNYYKQHNHIDYYTYNTEQSHTYDGQPFSLCLNDIGLRTQQFYGNNTEQVIEEFLFARNEIWEQQGRATHITTNLDKEEIERLFHDDHNRLTDRFKMFNVLALDGDSRR